MSLSQLPVQENVCIYMGVVCVCVCVAHTCCKMKYSLFLCTAVG